MYISLRERFLVIKIKFILISILYWVRGTHKTDFFVIYTYVIVINLILNWKGHRKFLRQNNYVSFFRRFEGDGTGDAFFSMRIRRTLPTGAFGLSMLLSAVSLILSDVRRFPVTSLDRFSIRIRLVRTLPPLSFVC